MKKGNAAELLRCFDPLSELTGKSASVIFIDSNPRSLSFLDFHTRLSAGEEPAGHSHSSRVISLCAGRRPTGVANASRIYTIFQRDALCGAPLYQVDCIGAPIVAIPWSAPDSAALRYTYCERISQLFGKRALVITSPGHEGPGQVRFPGTCISTLTVGIENTANIPTEYCGYNEERDKPDIWLPDIEYAAIDDFGRSPSINGTSAAVGVVAGLAALIHELLIRQHLVPDYCTLKAGILALTLPRKVGRAWSPKSAKLVRSLQLLGHIENCSTNSLSFDIPKRDSYCRLVFCADHNERAAYEVGQGDPLRYTLYSDGVTMAFGTTSSDTFVLDLSEKHVTRVTVEAPAGMSAAVLLGAIEDQ